MMNIDNTQGPDTHYSENVSKNDKPAEDEIFEKLSGLQPEEVLHILEEVRKRVRAEFNPKKTPTQIVWWNLLNGIGNDETMDRWRKIYEKWSDRDDYIAGLRRHFNSPFLDNEKLLKEIEDTFKMADQAIEQFLNDTLSEDQGDRGRLEICKKVKEANDPRALLHIIYGERRATKREKFEASRKLALFLLARSVKMDQRYTTRAEDSDNLEYKIFPHQLINPEGGYKVVNVKFKPKARGNGYETKEVNYENLSGDEINDGWEITKMLRFTMRGLRSETDRKKADIEVYSFIGNKWQIDEENNHTSQYSIPKNIHGMSIINYKTPGAILLKMIRDQYDSVKDGDLKQTNLPRDLIRMTLIPVDPAEEDDLFQILYTELGSFINRRKTAKGGNSKSSPQYKEDGHTIFIEEVHNEDKGRNNYYEFRVGGPSIWREKSKSGTHKEYRVKRSNGIKEILFPSKYY